MEGAALEHVSDAILMVDSNLLQFRGGHLFAIDRHDVGDPGLG